MKIILCDKNQDVINKCKTLDFDTKDTIEIICGDIFSQKFTAIATPSNSYGFVDGNFDYLVSEKYGFNNEMIRSQINSPSWGGMLPVGAAMLAPLKYNCRHDYNIKSDGSSFGQSVPIGVYDNPLVIISPTMHIPMDISKTNNCYFALRAALFLASFYKVDTIAIPAFGCGCGGLSPSLFANQFKAAIEHYNNPPQYKNWQELQIAYYKLMEE